ncbi:MAG: membrane protein insertion efficiency factor YidD [Acidiferrobacterales bacterium]|nr:membrane protein insertion efficiency factor YidD [Gammaproteobacteria bacterium]
MQKILIALIRGYRYLISPTLGSHCRFYPTCSEYALHAIREHGSVRGLWLSAWRLLRCHPWRAGGYDPVPSPGGARRSRPSHG